MHIIKTFMTMILWLSLSNQAVAMQNNKPSTPEIFTKILEIDAAMKNACMNAANEAAAKVNSDQTVDVRKASATAAHEYIPQFDIWFKQLSDNLQKEIDETISVIRKNFFKNKSATVDEELKLLENFCDAHRSGLIKIRNLTLNKEAS